MVETPDEFMQSKADVLQSKMDEKTDVVNINSDDNIVRLSVDLFVCLRKLKSLRNQIQSETGEDVQAIIDNYLAM